jgi:hypothetical protein
MKKSNQLALGSIVEQADELAIRHQEVMKYINIGRTGMYELLGKIFSLSEQIDADPNKKDVLENLKLELFNKYAIKTQRNSSPANVLVRYITQADRKTAHVYARAIDTAKAEGIKPENMVTYLEQKGGVEKIRQLGVVQKKDDVENKSWLNRLENRTRFMSEILEVAAEKPLAVFEMDKKHESRFKDQARYGEYRYVVCKRDGYKYLAVDLLPMDYEFESLLLDRLFKYISTQSFLTLEEVEKIKKAKVNLKTNLEKYWLRVAELEAEKEKNQESSPSLRALKSVTV